MTDRIWFEIVPGTKGRTDLAVLRLRDLEQIKDGTFRLVLTIQETRFLHRSLERYILQPDQDQKAAPKKTP